MNAEKRQTHWPQRPRHFAWCVYLAKAPTAAVVTPDARPPTRWHVAATSRTGVAEAFLAASKRADFSLQNAGGVRVPLQAGGLSMNTAFTLLPFTNVLVEVELTGA
jgi:hypothetical protein